MSEKPSIKDFYIKLCLGQVLEPIIFDIGACEGESSKEYKIMFPDARIHAFEPLPDNITLIRKNISSANLEHIQVNEFCLSEEEGNSEFYVSSGSPPGMDLSEYTDLAYWNKSSSLLPPGEIDDLYGWLEFKDKITVRTTRLDTYCTDNKISKIDFVHMDVQGAELKVLKGAGDMLKRIDLIWMEVSSFEIYKNQPLKKEVNKFMLNAGFLKILDIGDHITGDELWIHNEHLNSFSPEIIRRIRTESIKSSIRFYIDSTTSRIKSMLSKLKKQIAP